MEIEINIIDAFTDSVFKGNPAAVIITNEWLQEDLMQSIAIENNLSETAFLISAGESKYQIRWFSPITEIGFCGHATLASAFVLFEKDPDLKDIEFFAKAVGKFSAIKDRSGKIQMDFPSKKPEKIEFIPENLILGLSIEPVEIYRSSQAYFVIYAKESDVLSVNRNNELLAKLKPFDIVATCQSEDNRYDFVSRYFWPANGGDEDPVTGSIHAGLAPFWAERLGKKELIGYQASKRGGVLSCIINGDRVLISGNAVQYLKGTIQV